MHVNVKELPAPLANFLKDKCYYYKDSIEILPREKVSPQGYGGDGIRSFFGLFNLADGRGTVTLGSWGGPNIFNQENVVDEMDADVPLVPNLVAIKGTMDSNARFAQLFCSPSTLAPMLPNGDPGISMREAHILYAFRALKSGSYRKDFLSSGNVIELELSNLASRGFLKQLVRGWQITASGKNAIEQKTGQRFWQPSDMRNVKET